ncbi:pyridine nucleotide-disulfide oxidoreductase [Pseudomonas citronellolis]|uniref:Pyridine nucleotide-disulfide oxidoreductase n=1 Tax=Pseudomonas citronellolis TaxID=53408 RepID=A0A1A9KJ18_9PSED|nr:FAD/NAD(P)-binding oxidoreductase [Pseudomonas citronellolis]ANI17518.1 pyridine nucleotide-disulfide oxidoreductase [Pseudomonas citronellolis]
MSTTSHCIIVGGSHAGAQAAASLRQEGYAGAITLICAESLLPYHRPPLSKAFLCADKGDEELLIRPAEFYAKQNIEVRLNTRVTSIDAQGRSLLCDDGQRLEFTQLVLATGADVRRLALPGAELPGVCYLRTRDDVLKLREFIRPQGRAVIVGAGYIGLETAASLRKQGMQVTVLEAQSRVLQRVTVPEVSEFYTRVHREEGVEFILDAKLECITGEGRVEAVVLADGQRLPADLVVVGIGVLPNVELAQQLGLECDNGIVVDEQARTACEGVYAVGDCTRHHNPIYDTWLRLESVQNATDQARVAAQSICGKPAAYKALPWFWSDQYDLKLQIAGLCAGYDRVVIRGDQRHGRSFSAFYFQGSRLLAVDAVNRPKEFTFGKRFLAEGRTADPRLLADESVDFQACFS